MNYKRIFESDFVLKNVKIYCFFLFIVFSLCSLPLQHRTASLYRHRLILETMGVLKPWRVYLGWNVQKLYKTQVHKVWLQPKTGQLFWKKKPDTFPLYVIGKSASDVQHYAFPFSFPGAYGQIEGMVGLKGDGGTISGLQIIRQNELGLGAKWGWGWYSWQFKGKRFADSNQRYTGIKVVNGNMKEKVPASDVIQTVQGVRGAMHSNNKIEWGLNDTFARYDIFSKTLRGDSR